LAIGIAFLGISVGLFWFQGRPPKQIVLGKFTAVIGVPLLQHTGERSTLNPQRSTPICLGDRVETGDADRAEIQFHDGTTLRLQFNTSLEIPNPKSESSSDSQSALRSRLRRPPELKSPARAAMDQSAKDHERAADAVRTPVATAVARGTEFD
jgi:hypothetical protein